MRVVTIPPLKLNLIWFMKEVEAWGAIESNSVPVGVYYLKAVLVQRERKTDGGIALPALTTKCPWASISTLVCGERVDTSVGYKAVNAIYI